MKPTRPAGPSPGRSTSPPPSNEGAAARSARRGPRHTVLAGRRPHEQLRARPADQREHDVLDEDVARLSPLMHANLNVLGRYSCSGPAGGALRPLHDPAEAEEDGEE